MSNQIFRTLKELSTSLHLSQCVIYKHELLICGLKLIDNSNEIKLLSFGGNKETRHKLVMKYVSVCDNINKPNEFNNCNRLIPFTYNYIIQLSLEDIKVIVIMKNNNLLLSLRKNNISLFDLNKFQFIKPDTLPTDNWICYNCFVYSNFQFHQLHVCDDIAPFNEYAYVDIILFFDEYCWNSNKSVYSKSVYKYSTEKKNRLNLKTLYTIHYIIQNAFHFFYIFLSITNILIIFYNISILLIDFLKFCYFSLLYIFSNYQKKILNLQLKIVMI
ncbi:hypothetical protein RFI_29952 [Reticulomyxa filosa]|uniref:Uncharacterized protein n=1 Tax=Reticulomyxa filosa TaxID=46433 RepID=X6LZV6_RETFI|nr:hypothetical protein RFI_29952 [Reticulomyxa filosa]|eukprot:ETO07438.1 hypothetical protein RFI_29952 [Reticulomyxa filosa]